MAERRSRMLAEDRNHPRSCEEFKLEITGVYDPGVTEVVSVENVSSQGVRATTTRRWEPGSHVDLTRPNGEKWARARVVYCKPNGEKRFAVGLNLLSRAGDRSPKQ